MWLSILGRINLWWGAPLWCGGQSHLEWQTSSEFWTGVFGEKISSLNITLAGRRRLLMGGRQDDQQGVCWGNRWTGAVAFTQGSGVAMIREEVETWWPWWMDVEVEGKSVIKTYLHALAWITEQMVMSSVRQKTGKMKTKGRQWCW